MSSIHVQLSTWVLLIWPYLRGQVKRPEEKSEHAARHHGNDRERQQPIPLAVVLHVRPDFCRHQTLPQFGYTFHPDLDSVCILADPRPPPPGGLDRYPRILAFWGVSVRIPQGMRRSAANEKQINSGSCLTPADPVWGEETLTKGFLVKPNGLSLPDANRGFSTQVLLKKASALISLSSYSSLWVITTPSHPIHEKPQQPFPCDQCPPLKWLCF